jgi:hypothetical protein
VTNYYDIVNVPDSLNEARQGCIMADIAKETGVKLFIWSTVPSALLRSSAQFDSPKLVENKFYVSQYLKYKKVPHVDLYLGFYMDNWINFGQIKKVADGTIEIVQPCMKPDVKVGMTWIKRDLGRVVVGILGKFFKGEDVLGQSFYCVTGQYNMNELRDTIQQELGHETRIITPPATGVRDLDIMYDFYNVWGVYRDIETPDPSTLTLIGKFSSLSDYVKEAVGPAITSL